jgi:hypothetical protein
LKAKRKITPPSLSGILLKDCIKMVGNTILELYVLEWLMDLLYIIYWVAQGIGKKEYVRSNKYKILWESQTISFQIKNGKKLILYNRKILV